MSKLRAFLGQYSPSNRVADAMARLVKTLNVPDLEYFYYDNPADGIAYADLEGIRFSIVEAGVNRELFIRLGNDEYDWISTELGNALYNRSLANRISYHLDKLSRTPYPLEQELKLVFGSLSFVDAIYKSDHAMHYYIVLNYSDYDDERATYLANREYEIRQKFPRMEFETFYLRGVINPMLTHTPIFQKSPKISGE